MRRGIPIRERNYRWKWMAGASAAAAVVPVQAATVTINLSGNYLSSSSAGLVDSLNPEFLASLGELHPIVAFSNRTLGRSNGSYRVGVSVKGLAPSALGVRAAASLFANGYAVAQVASSRSEPSTRFAPAFVTGTIPITFTDPLVNGGTQTTGYLQISAVTTLLPGVARASAVVQLDSFSYDVTASVPANGSTLEMLALGAGGVIALRQRRKAA